MAERLGDRMKTKARNQQGKGTMAIMEEAVYLLRTLPLRAFSAYYTGSLPFVLGFLYFWADMSQGAFAYRYSVEAALLISVLFLWMKTWHVLFTGQLNACVGNNEATDWSPKKILNIFIVQTVIQSTAFFVLPVALLLALPFGWVYAFYQNVSVFGNGENGDIKQVYKKSIEHAMLFPFQNHMILFILPLFGFFVFMNFAVTILLVPSLLNTFFGIQLLSARAAWSMFNTTFIAVTCGLTYLVMDPLVKAVYTIRCFYGESLYNGNDLMIELKHYRPAMKSLLFLILSLLSMSVLISSSPALADDRPAASPVRQSQGSFIHIQEMDHAIEEVINQRTYSWRIPRQKPEKEEEDNVLKKFMKDIIDGFTAGLKAVGEWINDAMEWILDHLFSRDNNREVNKGWAQSVNILLYVLLAIITCVLAILIRKTWRKRHHRDAEEIKLAVPSPPDIADENIRADALPADRWLNMAAELMERGDHRLALRALYLASLSYLAQRGMISVAHYKSNRDYARELRRKTHSESDLLTAFVYNMGIFESIWYGMHDVTRETIERFRENHGRIMAFHE